MTAEAKIFAEVLLGIKQLIISKPNEWLPIYAALGGATTGALISMLATFFLEKQREKRARKNLSISLIVEVKSIIKMIEYRNIVADIKNIIDELKNKPNEEIRYLTIKKSYDLAKIYHDNCSQIGSIESKLASQIIIFHQLIDATYEDVKPGGPLSDGYTIDGFKECLALLEQAIAIGNSIIKENRKYL